MKGSEYFQGVVGSVFDLFFGIGGDGRKFSSAEHYDAEETATPDIHIHGNLHTDQSATIPSGAVPVAIDPTLANTMALQEGYAQANASPVYEMRAPDYPPMPSPVGHDYTPAAPVYPPPPTYSELSAAALHQAMQEQDHGIRM